MLCRIVAGQYRELLDRIHAQIDPEGAAGWAVMAFPNDDPTVQHGDRAIQLIDWLVGRLEECLGEVLPLQTDDLLKDYAKEARNSMASAIEQLSLGRAKKEQQLGGRTS